MRRIKSLRTVTMSRLRLLNSVLVLFCRFYDFDGAVSATKFDKFHLFSNLFLVVIVCYYYLRWSLCHYFTTILRILVFKNHLHQNISKPYTFWFILKLVPNVFQPHEVSMSISMLRRLMIWHKVCNLLLMINLWKIIEHRIPTHLPLITTMIVQFDFECWIIDTTTYCWCVTFA